MMREMADRIGEDQMTGPVVEDLPSIEKPPRLLQLIVGRLRQGLARVIEWECAARGGLEGKRYPWGDELPEYATRSLSGPNPVGRRAPNGYGLHDMCENIHEWCSDWYAADYYSVSPDRNPQGPSAGSRRASRGGSWRHQITVSRCAARSSIPPEFQYADYGFRIVAQRAGS
jgi:formylglycine-generating enzyme required for sulfatase activity